MSPRHRWATGARVTAGVLIVLLAGVAAHTQVFRLTVDAVAVDVRVTLDGRPVTDLAPSAFTLQDNGVPQAVEVVRINDLPLTLFLVLDTSGSVLGEPLRQLRTAAMSTLTALRPADRVALLTFSHHVRMTIPPTTPDALPGTLARLRATGATALYDATFAAIALRETTPGPSLVLVFSDGVDTVSWLDPRDVLTAVQRSHAVVYGVTLERSSRARDPADRRGQEDERRWFSDEPQLFARQYLPTLVDETGGTLHVAGAADELATAFAEALRDFRSRYLLTYSPQGVDTDGWHEIQVEVDRQDVAVRARPGYLR